MKIDEVSVVVIKVSVTEMGASTVGTGAIMVVDEVTVVVVGNVVDGATPVPGQMSVLLGLPDRSCNVPVGRTEMVSGTLPL
jgi:hypothetical protein